MTKSPPIPEIIEPSAKKQTMPGQRIAMGIIGVSMLTLAMYVYFFSPDMMSTFVTGVFSKVGLLLIASFIAYPAIANLNMQVPPIVSGTALTALLAIVIRPRLIIVAIPMALLVLAVHFGLRRAANKFGR